MELTVGTRIYYTGDMANVDDFGTITRVLPRDNYQPRRYDITLDDGRIWPQVWELGFEPGAGRRWWTEEEWEADRKAKLQAFYGKYYGSKEMV